MLEITNHGQVREIRMARPPVNALNTELEFANTTAESIASFVDTWFPGETQQVMNALVAQLKSKNWWKKPYGSIGRAGSCIHSLHEPTYSFELGNPTSSPAKILWQAVTPEPHMCTRSFASCSPANVSSP